MAASRCDVCLAVLWGRPDRQPSAALQACLSQKCMALCCSDLQAASVCPPHNPCRLPHRTEHAHPHEVQHGGGGARLGGGGQEGQPECHPGGAAALASCWLSWSAQSSGGCSAGYSLMRREPVAHAWPISSGSPGAAANRVGGLPPVASVADRDAAAGVGGAHNSPGAAEHPEKGGAHAQRQRWAAASCPRRILGLQQHVVASAAVRTCCAMLAALMCLLSLCVPMLCPVPRQPTGSWHGWTLC